MSVGVLQFMPRSWHMAVSFKLSCAAVFRRPDVVLFRADSNIAPVVSQRGGEKGRPSENRLEVLF